MKCDYLGLIVIVIVIIPFIMIASRVITHWVLRPHREQLIRDIQRAVSNSED